MSELAWDWHQISVALMWRKCPNGLVITRKDLGELPRERVLVDDRDEAGTEIRFRFVPLKVAEAMRPKILLATGKKAGVGQLQGRWQKIGVVVLWKLCRDGITLTPKDLEAVPKDRILLMHGHADDLELRFVPRDEAARIQRWERDNEGKQVLEVMQ